MEYVKDICEIGEKAGKLLKKINRDEEIKVSDAPAVKELISIVQKSMDVKRMDEEGGYSQGGDWMAEGTYGRGSSNANRGQHLVRSHYSRDSGMDRNGDSSNGYSSRRDNRGRYSRDNGLEEMMEHLEAAYNAATPEMREDIKRFMREVENA